MLDTPEQAGTARKRTRAGRKVLYAWLPVEIMAPLANEAQLTRRSMTELVEEALRKRYADKPIEETGLPLIRESIRSVIREELAAALGIYDPRRPEGSLLGEIKAELQTRNTSLINTLVNRLMPFLTRATRRAYLAHELTRSLAKGFEGYGPEYVASFDREYFQQAGQYLAGELPERGQPESGQQPRPKKEPPQ